MMDHDEYKTAENQTISIQCNSRGIWEVGCWNEDDSAHWYLEFVKESDARNEYERWRS